MKGYIELIIGIIIIVTIILFGIKIQISEFEFYINGIFKKWK